MSRTAGLPQDFFSSFEKKEKKERRSEEAFFFPFSLLFSS